MENMNQVMFLKNEIIQNAKDDGNNRGGGNGGNGGSGKGGGHATVNRFKGSTPLALEDLEFINEIEKISSRIEDRSPTISKTSSPNSFTNPSSSPKTSSSNS